MEFRDSSTSLGMTKGINYEAHEGHEEFVVATSGGERALYDMRLIFARHFTCIGACPLMIK